MKIKLPLLCFFILSVSSCVFDTNITDVQVSKSIKASKENGMFIREYVPIRSDDSTIRISEAWIEKWWWYTQNGLTVKKVARKGCKLCFAVKQYPDFKYRAKNFTKWHMKYMDDYASTHGPYKIGEEEFALYCVSVANCSFDDTVSVDLINVINTNSEVIKRQVGKLVFAKK